MKKTLRTLILTLGVLATTGISSAVYAQDCNTTNYKVVNAQDAKTINCTVKAGDSLKDMCAKYGVVVPKGLEAKPQVSNTCKATATKVAPAKTTPSKATPTSAPAPVPVKPAPTKTPAATNLTENNKLEKEVVTLVNQERAKQGLAPLKENAQLSNVARYKSEDMVANNYFSHTSPTYGSPFDMMKKFGITYTAAGENIAMGQQTAASVMNGWMNSPGHKANILSANFTEIGVGVAKDKSGTIYWTQEFIGK
ncbi:CAP domain-containing protein [Clostridium tagluense]|uniref:CAP domain-containing protein n=1 Tax=Clostridium tagluense TaxID=360422 RepID=UPI001C0BF6EE|nr:CAP domain-containing protein [Clostridium tagluense]MBU3127421.1 serine protease [Clostridium tagluense]